MTSEPFSEVGVASIFVGSLSYFCSLFTTAVFVWRLEMAAIESCFGLPVKSKTESKASKVVAPAIRMTGVNDPCKTRKDGTPSMNNAQIDSLRIDAI